MEMATLVVVQSDTGGVLYIRPKTTTVEACEQLHTRANPKNRSILLQVHVDNFALYRKALRRWRFRNLSCDIPIVGIGKAPAPTDHTIEFLNYHTNHLWYLWNATRPATRLADPDAKTFCSYE